MNNEIWMESFTVESCATQTEVVILYLTKNIVPQFLFSLRINTEETIVFNIDIDKTFLKQ